MSEPTVVGAADGLSAARLYAEATARRLVAVDDPRDVIGVLKSGASSCLISAGTEVSAEDLGGILSVALAANVPLGFIAGWAGGDAAESHAKKLLARESLMEAPSAIWSIAGIGRYNMVQMPLLREHQGGSLLFGSADGLTVSAPWEQSLPDMLRGGLRAAALITHGFGAHAVTGWGPMCAIANEAHARPDTEERFLPCASGGPCVYDYWPRGEYRALPKFDPADVVADVLLFLSCHGFLTSDSRYDPRLSIGQRLVESDSVGAVITSYKQAPLSAELHALALLAILDLERGDSFGHVALELNRGIQQDRSNLLAPWVLLGDPESRLDARNSTETIRINTDEPIRVSIRPGLSDLEIVRPAGTPKDPLITVTPVGGAELAEQDFWVHSVRDLDRAPITFLGAEPIECEITAHLARLPHSYQVISSILERTQAILFSARVIEMIRRSPPGSDTGKDLEDELHVWLYRQTLAAFSLLPGFLSGTNEVLEKIADEFRGSWEALNARLLEFLAWQCRWMQPQLEFLYAFGVRTSEEVASERCHYCAGLVGERELVDPVSREIRTVFTCSTCGLLTDSVEGVGPICLEGPTSIVSGSTVEYALEFPPTSKPMYFRAQLILGLPAPVLWEKAELASSVGETWTEAGKRSNVTVTIDVPDTLPAGSYGVTAAIAAHGDLWVAGRPVRVSRPS